MALVVKNQNASAGGTGLILGLERSPGGGNGNPVHSCLENYMDRITWWATGHTVVAESDTTKQGGYA